MLNITMVLDSNAIEFIVDKKSILILMNGEGIRRFPTHYPIDGAEYDRIDKDNTREGHFIKIVGVDLW